VGGSCIPLALGLASCTRVFVKFVRYWHNSLVFGLVKWVMSE
jgi:hypothetical protein